MEKKRAYLSVRPQFDPGLAMVQSIMVTAAGFFIVTFLGGIITFLLFTIIGLSNYISFSVIFGFYALLSLAGIPPLYYEIKKRAMQRTLFNFYDDYLDFQYFQFYINRRRGRVWYRDIADITQHATALQEHQRLTTIHIYVPGLAQQSQRGVAGVKLEDLPQSKGYLTKIMDIVHFSATGEMPGWLMSAFPQPAYTPPVETVQTPVEAAAPAEAAKT